MKVIFLDFDGVLNNASWMHEAFAKPDRANLSMFQKDVRELSPDMIRRILNVIDTTGAAVVISSSWRKLMTLDEIRELFREAGFPQMGAHIIDRTPTDREVQETGIPRDTGVMRGHEIDHWIKEFEKKNGRLTSFVIIDDDSDMLDSQLSNFVHTSWESGIQDTHVQEAIRILGETRVPV